MTISKNQIKFIRSLHQSKYRQMYEKFIAEGHKIAIEILHSKKFSIEWIFAHHTWISENESFLSDYSAQLISITDEQMAQISLLKNPTKVLIIAQQNLQNLNELKHKKGNYFYLDGVQDPGNVGTIVRLADWFGFIGVIASDSSADFFHPKVVQASMASICGVDLIKSNHTDLFAQDHLSIYAMDGGGVDYNQVVFSHTNVIVLGNEGQGISEDIIQRLDPKKVLSIAGSKSCIAESLNVGAAAAVIANHLFGIH